MMMIFTILVYLLGASRASDLFDNKLYHDVQDPVLCARQLESIDKHLFYDSSFRVPEGIVHGNFIHLGNYYQCLDINQDFPGSKIEGKYCMIKAKKTVNQTLKIPMLGGISESNDLTWSEWKQNSEYLHTYIHQHNGRQISNTSTTRHPVIESVTLSLAVCVPKSCTAHALLRPYAEHPRINFTYEEQFCRLRGDKPFAVADYMLTAFWSLLILLIVISTSYEVCHIFILKKDTNKLLCVFSVYSNTARLLTVDDNPRAMHCLDGIRTLSTLKIILNHSYSDFTANIGLDYAQGQKQLKYMWMFASNKSVDTFLALSGMLLVYSTAYKMKQEYLLRNFYLIYLHRYLRLFPLLAGVMLLQASLLHVNDGPFWYIMSEQVAYCRGYWWSTLLYVQYLPYRKCISQTWYLAVDMQLHVVSPLVLYWVLGSARAARTALTAAVLASLVATFAICSYFNFKALFWTDAIYASWYYCNTITRSPPFFIGMLFGYALHVCWEKKLYLPKWSVFLGYCLSLMLFFYAICIVHPTLQPDSDNQLALNVHNALFRSCWALAICWLIFACAHGYGGPVNWFLALKLWKFPARISYAMFLYSRRVQFVRKYSIIAANHYGMEYLVTRFLGDLVYTVMISVVACVMIEEPFIRLLKIPLRSRTTK